MSRLLFFDLCFMFGGTLVLFSCSFCTLLYFVLFLYFCNLLYFCTLLYYLPTYSFNTLFLYFCILCIEDYLDIIFRLYI